MTRLICVECTLDLTGPMVEGEAAVLVVVVAEGGEAAVEEVGVAARILALRRHRRSWMRS